MVRTRFLWPPLGTLLVACALVVLPRAGFAQTQQVPPELARARLLLERSRAELSSQQYALLSSRLAETEAAYAELVAAAQAAGEVVAANGAASTAVATGGRALLGGLAELLPALMIVWPATANAPGNKPEKPAVRAARSKLDESTKALAAAAQQVEAEQKAATSGAGKGFTDDTECKLHGSGGGGMPSSPWTCKYNCNEVEIIIILRTKESHCPGEETYGVKWKEIKGFERKP